VSPITDRDFLARESDGGAGHDRFMSATGRRAPVRLLLLGLTVALVGGSIGLVSPVAARNGAVASSPTLLVGARRVIARCPILPSTNVWNRRVDTLPVASNSGTLMATMNRTSAHLHPDFGTNAGYGIPYNAVLAATPWSSVTFDWPEESDAGPYPIPTNPKIEGAGAGGDRHILMLDTRSCRLWELFAAQKVGGIWEAGSGAIFDLQSNALRPDGWTSADAAGLPIYPGLARYDEVAAGAINHALRFTVPETRKAHTYPARHHASSLTGTQYPPMGLRLRLKASVDISGYGPQSRVILTALKRYGMILADNGSGYYISGAPDPRWDDEELHDLHGVTGSMFEVVNTTGFINGP
jgi:hypothetical protein